MDYLGRDLHNGQPATQRAVGCVGKVAAMQRRRRREEKGRGDGEKGKREGEKGRGDGEEWEGGRRD